MRAVTSGRGWALLLLTAAGAACSGQTDATDGAPPELRAALAARTIYPAKREEWRTDITSHTDSTMRPLVFRASGTTVALLQASPTRISQFELHGKGMLLSTRPARVDPLLHAEVPRDIVAPTDLSRATDDAHVDVIDSATSTLVRESLGGFVFRRDLPILQGTTLVLAGFFLIGWRNTRAAAGFLALASLFFYGWWSVKALPLLLALAPAPEPLPLCPLARCPCHCAPALAPASQPAVSE